MSPTRLNPRHAHCAKNRTTNTLSLKITWCKFTLWILKAFKGFWSWWKALIGSIIIVQLSETTTIRQIANRAQETLRITRMPTIPCPTQRRRLWVPFLRSMCTNTAVLSAVWPLKRPKSWPYIRNITWYVTRPNVSYAHATSDRFRLCWNTSKAVTTRSQRRSWHITSSALWIILCYWVVFWTRALRRTTLIPLMHPWTSRIQQT